MAQSQGSTHVLKMVPESSWGVKPTVNAGDSIVIPFEKHSLNFAQPREQNPNIKSSRAHGPGVLGLLDTGGGIDFRLNGNAHGQVLKALCGACSTTNIGAGTAYQHTIKLGSTLPSYTIEAGYTDISKWLLYQGMRCGSATFRINPAGFVEVSTSWLGKSEHSTSPVGATYDASPDNYTDAVFALTNANVAVAEGGSGATTLLGLEFTVDNMLDGNVYTVANGGARGDLPAGMCKVTGKLSAMFDGTTLYSKAAAGTESSLLVTLQRGTGAGTAGNEKLAIHLDEILYTRASPPVEGPMGVKLDLEFEAFVDDDADASPVWFYLENTVAAYA